MTTLQWQPSGRNLSLGTVVDRFLGERFWDSGADAPAGDRYRSLPVNISEGSDEVIVVAAMPGVDPDQVDIAIGNGYLWLGAEAKGYSSEDHTRWLRLELGERRYGRRIVLPTGLDPGGAEASYDQGLLTLKIPKAESAKIKKIKIGEKANR